MVKGNIDKKVGTISDEVVERYKLYEYRNANIMQPLSLYIHIAKHVKEFLSVDSFNNTIANIPQIIKEPSFVYHDSNRKSLLYFKEIDETVCVVVKLNLRKNKNPYVATIYPVNERKIKKLKELSYILNR